MKLTPQHWHHTTTENFDRNVAIVEQLEAFAKKKDCTAAQLCLAWVHAKGAIPIPGTKSPKRLEENAKVRFLPCWLARSALFSPHLARVLFQRVWLQCACVRAMGSRLRETRGERQDASLVGALLRTYWYEMTVACVDVGVQVSRMHSGNPGAASCVTRVVLPTHLFPFEDCNPCARISQGKNYPKN